MIDKHPMCGSRENATENQRSSRMHGWRRGEGGDKEEGGRTVEAKKAKENRPETRAEGNRDVVSAEA